MKSESHVVVDPAHAHGLQRGLDHLQSMLVTGPMPVAQKEEEVVGCGKLGGRSEAPVLGIVNGVQGRVAPLKKCAVQICGRGLI